MGLIAGGHPTIYVSDFGASLRFYTETLGLALLERVGDEWATVDCGAGRGLALHAAMPAAPRPGTSGAITVGFAVTQPLELAVEALRARGVWFRGDIVDTARARLAYFGDPDGNDLYLTEAPDS